MTTTIDYYASSKMMMFTGKKDWLTWSEMFLVRANQKGYKSLLVDSSVVIPKTAQVTLTDEEKKIKKLNENAYGDLLSALDLKKDGGKVAFSIIRGTKDTEYEEGNAQGVHYSKIVSVLVKSIQELKDEIDILKAQVNG